MRNKTLKLLSKVMCLFLIASFASEAPLLAAFEAIKVNVGGQQVQVTPGQWVSVRQGTQTVNYNVRYVDGRPVALKMSQYMKLIFGGGSAVTTGASTAGTSGSTTKTSATSAPATTSGSNAPVSTSGSTSGLSQSVSNAPAGSNVPTSSNVPTGSNAPATSNAPTTSNVSTVAENGVAASGKPVTSVAEPAAPVSMQADSSVSGAAQSGTKAPSGSWIKDELNSYGSKIKDSFSAGKETGNKFGTNTVEGAKKGISAVGNGVKSTGSKIGDLLRGAKERIAKIFQEPDPSQR